MPFWSKVESLAYGEGTVSIVDWGGFGHGVNSDSIRNGGAI